MEKIAEKQRKSGLKAHTTFGKRERPYSYSGANENMFTSSKKRDHYMFVVDWQLDNDNSKFPE